MRGKGLTNRHHSRTIRLLPSEKTLVGTVRYTTVQGEVIAEKRAGTRKFYVPDPLGSTVALLDNTQTQTDTFSYWPYGEVKTRTGTTGTPFQYLGALGYYQDSSVGQYVRMRCLNVATGGWLTVDPLWHT